jgi:hypothetical protein
MIRKLLFLPVVIFLFLSSCGEGSGETEGNFWAHDYTKNTRYKIQASLLAENEYCEIWVDSSSSVTKTMAINLAYNFNNSIYKKISDVFGSAFLSDIMTTADTLGDGNGKLCILLLSIKDGSDLHDNSYVAGYFWPDDLSEGDYSNNRDMIYINTKTGLSGMGDINATIAHELQHLINYISSILYRSEFAGGQFRTKKMDTWIDEGLSSAVEWIYTGSHIEDRVRWYSQNGNFRKSSLIDKGNNFFVWGNRTDENEDAVQDDYATVYLFFQWLRLQSGGTAIYKDILTSEYSNYLAVTEAAAARINTKYKDNWGELLQDWLAANYLNSTSTNTTTRLYGYRNETVLRDITAHFLPEREDEEGEIITTYPLYPGEGVYSFISVSLDVPVSDPSGNIRYVGLRKSNASLIQPPNNIGVSTTSVNALLTFNVDTNEENEREEGTTTGAVPPPTANILPSPGRSVGGLSGPMPVSGTDMLKRNGF